MTSPPFCPHGYWVGPNGEVEPVSAWQCHNRDSVSIARKYSIPFQSHSHLETVSQTNAQQELYARGWVSVTVPFNSVDLNFIIVEVDPPKAQIVTLQKLIKEHGAAGAEHFQIGFFSFNTSREARRHLYEYYNIS